MNLEPATKKLRLEAKPKVHSVAAKAQPNVKAKGITKWAQPMPPGIPKQGLKGPIGKGFAGVQPSMSLIRACYGKGQSPKDAVPLLAALPPPAPVILFKPAILDVVGPKLPPPQPPMVLSSVPPDGPHLPKLPPPTFPTIPRLPVFPPIHPIQPDPQQLAELLAGQIKAAQVMQIRGSSSLIKKVKADRWTTQKRYIHH